MDNKHQYLIKTVQIISDNCMKFQLMNEKFACLKILSLIFSLRPSDEAAINELDSWNYVGLDTLREYTGKVFNLQWALLKQYEILY